jgi:hypothetical protein
MAGQAPFDKTDAEGIRRTASFLFQGGKVKSSGFKTYEREYGRRVYFYIYLADLFLACIDRERGTIIHWPFPGSLLDQPESTRQAWMIMQGVYFEKIQEDMEAQTAKLKRR